MDTKLLSTINRHFVKDTDIAIFFTMHMTDYTTLIKFANLNCMLSNMFINYITKNAVLEMFCNIQRFIHSIYRLKHIWLVQDRSQSKPLLRTIQHWVVQR
jgi:hypothetical protein